MKILLIHNFYQVPGGEDSVFKNESDLLRSHGCDVKVCTLSNDSVSGLIAKFEAFLGVVYSFHSYRLIINEIKCFKPDIVHVHNYFPLISPSVFYACKKANIPVVHTLHNYRAICPTALLMYDGKIEERSIKGSSWWAVRRKVYRNSLIGTFALSCMVAFHRRFGTWAEKVDRYIALTNFAKMKYIAAGWPESKIAVKSNFSHDPFNGSYSPQKKKNRAIYVGRLSEEKGIDTLLSAWESVSYPLVIVGDGPQKELVESCGNPLVTYLGRKSQEDVMCLVRESSVLIMVSRWYEGFPMVLVEAMANGTCSIVPSLGGMKEVVKDRITGLHFEPENPEDLANKCNSILGDSDLCAELSINARIEYQNNYNPDQNYKMLIDIYQQAISEVK